MGLKEQVAFRLVAFIPMLFILITVIFFALRVIPGDPARAIVGESASEEYVQQVRHSLGLDRPILEQYVEYMTNLFQGNLGKSIVYFNYVDVAAIISQKFKTTIQLASIAWVLSLLFGVTTGVYSSIREGKAADYIMRIVSLFLYAIPAFVLGIVLQLVFGAYLRILPVYGTLDEAYRPFLKSTTGFVLIDTLIAGQLSAFVNALSHFLLPALVLAASSLAYTSRLTRSEMLKALKRTYCLVAEAKGLNEGTIAFRHALRNAFLPIITLSGLQAISLFTGSILVESIFSLDGLGSLIVSAANQREYMLLQGSLTIFAIISLTFGLLIDVIYYFIDPRLRY